MGRVLKWAGIGVAGLLVLAVLAALFLPTLLNLERYRTLLAGRIGKALGREVALGTLHVSLWRGLGAEATGVRIAQAPGQGDEPFLTAEALRVHVQRLPLLKGQVKVASLTLERPRIRLLRHADGRWSLDDLWRTSPAPAPSRPSPEAPRAGKGPPSAAVLLEAVAIRNGEILLAEPGRPQGIRLTGLQATARQTSLLDPIEVQARASLAEPEGGTIAATGHLRPTDPEGASLDLTVTFTGLKAAAWQSALQAEPGRVSLSGTLAGEVKFSGTPERLAFVGQVNLARMGIGIGPWFEKAAGEAASLDLQGRREAAGLTLPAWRLRMKETTLEGNARIPDLAHPSLVFTAASDVVDLDRLLRQPRRAGAWLSPASAWAVPVPADPAPRGALSAAGSLRVGSLRHAGLLWQGVEADLRYQGGLLRARRITAGLLGGTVRAEGEVDFRSRNPRVHLTSHLEEIPTEPLVMALGLGPWTLRSQLTLDGQVSFVGFTLPEILGSAAGGGTLRLGEGRVVNYRPLERLSEVLAPILAAQGVGRVRLHEFAGLTGTYTLDNGILRSRDLTLIKTEGSITMSGALGMLDRALDADVVARLGRATVEAKLAGTTDRPIVVPKLGRLQRRPGAAAAPESSEERGKSLQDLFKRFFRP